MMYHLKRWQKRDVDKSVEGWIVICRKIIDIEEDMFFFFFLNQDDSDNGNKGIVLGLITCETTGVRDCRGRKREDLIKLMGTL